jgi:hypothetical protein
MLHFSGCLFSPRSVGPLLRLLAGGPAGSLKSEPGSSSGSRWLGRLDPAGRPRRRSSLLAGRSGPRVAGPKRPSAVAVLAQVHRRLRASLSSAALPPANGKLATLGKETVKYPSPSALAEPEMARANLGNSNPRSCRSCLVMFGHFQRPWLAWERPLAGRSSPASGSILRVGGFESAANDCGLVHQALSSIRAFRIQYVHPFQGYSTSHRSKWIESGRWSAQAGRRPC